MTAHTEYAQQGETSIHLCTAQTLNTNLRLLASSAVASKAPRKPIEEDDEDDETIGH